MYAQNALLEFAIQYISRQACEKCADYSHDGARDQEEPVDQFLGGRQFLCKKLEMKRYRKDDANAEAANSSEKRHDTIERRKDDCNADESNGSCNANKNPSGLVPETGFLVGRTG